jgi:uncharacterized heparinase superfamily protein
VSGGWSGGTANRNWQRGRRGPDSGRTGVAEDVRRILADWRAKHGWRPGYVWDPRTATYRLPPPPLPPA